MMGIRTGRPAVSEAYEWRGRNVVDQEGARVGTLEEIYLDQHTARLDQHASRPEWMLIHTGLFGGTKASFAPLTGAQLDDEDVRIAYTRQEVKDAPSVGADGELSREEEARLYEHYGLDYPESGGAGPGW
jgi:sporulation protein YlmC with PRC-barrel domain